jgi:hypothetical protein
LLSVVVSLFVASVVTAAAAAFAHMTAFASAHCCRAHSLP